MSASVLVVSDLHLGAEPEAFCLQPRHLELWPRLLTALTDLAQRHQVARIIACGDLTHHGTAAEIATFRRDISALAGCWVYCLGNHDLCQPDSFQAWGMSDGVTELDGWDIITVHNAWMVNGAAGFRWWEPSDWHELLLPQQLDWLAQTLAARSDRPAILVVHAPLDPFPKRLIGDLPPTHVPHPAYAEQLNRLLDLHPRVKLVLSGHNHAHTATRHGGRIHLTTAALLEVPFEVRVVSLTDRSIRVETQPLVPLPPGVQYDASRAWANGQPVDRMIELKW